MVRNVVTKPGVAVVAVCWLCVGLPGQRIWKVNHQGSPVADFSDLPPAVAAASPGDEIWVFYDLTLPGNPAYFTAPIITKPLRIQGFLASGPGSGGAGPYAVGVVGPLVIMNIPAGQRVEVSDLSLVNQIYDPCGIVALDCQGDVLLENVSVVENTSAINYVHAERCANVVFRGCTFQLGGSPLRAIDSNVLLTTTAIWYYPPGVGLGFGWSYPATTEAVRVVNSTVTAVDSVIWGADPIPNLGPNYILRPGVVVESGTLRVGPGSSIHGGTDGQGWIAPAITLVNPALGHVEHDPRGLIFNPGYPPFPQVEIDSVFHNWAVANESFGVIVAGPANGYALLCFGDWQPGLPSPWGTLALDPATMVPVTLVPLPAPDGIYQWTFACPIWAPIAHAFAFQALTIGPNGALGVTEPSPLTINWPHGVLPW